jgi:hypothetical protein
MVITIDKYSLSIVMDSGAKTGDSGHGKPSGAVGRAQE